MADEGYFKSEMQPERPFTGVEFFLLHRSQVNITLSQLIITEKAILSVLLGAHQKAIILLSFYSVFRGLLQVMGVKTMPLEKQKRHGHQF